MDAAHMLTQHGLTFFKCEGAGNDFIIIDRIGVDTPFSPDLIPILCERRKSVGADGLILLESSAEEDFHMRYFNADGSMGICANGARCAAAVVELLGITKNNSDSYRFSVAGSPLIMHAHRALKNIHLQWQEIIPFIEAHTDGWLTQVGGLHFIQRVMDRETLMAVSMDTAKALQADKKRFPAGVNVHFIYVSGTHIHVRTLERGIAEEVRSCGTGSAAVAIIAKEAGWIPAEVPEVEVYYPLCKERLQVRVSTSQKLTDITLIGQVNCVYAGNYQPQPCYIA